MHKYSHCQTHFLEYNKTNKTLKTVTGYSEDLRQT